MLGLTVPDKLLVAADDVIEEVSFCCIRSGLELAPTGGRSG